MKETLQKLTARMRWALVGGTVIVAGSTLAFSRIAEKHGDQAAPVHVVVDDTPVQRSGNFTTSFAPLVKTVSPSVVKVFVTSKGKVMSQFESPFENNPFFRRFFGDSPEGMQPMPAPRQHGLGSGVIVSKDGYILTNNHVVDNADEIKVAVGQDKKIYTAKVIGTDPKTDIAVLKIDADDLKPITLGNSDKVEVGDLALAIGNPFGIGETVTMGMISAKGRGNVGIEDYEDFIQTDAAINPGNSGGALVDAEGRLIGINTAILSQSGGNHGIGFAVPVNLARTVMDSLIAHGRVVRGFLGVTIQDVDADLAKQFNLEKASGALVADVTHDSPADKAGLKSGDVIVNFNGKSVADSRRLKLSVAQTAPESKVPVTVVRNGKEKTLEVVLKELPGTRAMAEAGGNHHDSGDHLSGVAVSDLDRNSRRQSGAPDGVEGALVTQVDPTSPAYEAGLRPGDIIQEINRQTVKNADDAVALSEKINDDTILLRVWSRGGSHYLVVDESRSS